MAKCHLCTLKRAVSPLSSVDVAGARIMPCIKMCMRQPHVNEPRSQQFTISPFARRGLEADYFPAEYWTAEHSLLLSILSFTFSLFFPWSRFAGGGFYRFLNYLYNPRFITGVPEILTPGTTTSTEYNSHNHVQHTTFFFTWKLAPCAVHYAFANFVEDAGIGPGRNQFEEPSVCMACKLPEPTSWMYSV